MDFLLLLLLLQLLETPTEAVTTNEYDNNFSNGNNKDGDKETLRTN